MDEERREREPRKEIFTSKVRAGSRTYYFDVKKTGKNDNYLVISESKRVGNDHNERHRIMIFEEDIRKFFNSFSEVMDFLETDKN